MRRLETALLLLGAAALAVAAWDVATGGFYFTVAGVRVSSREAHKPFRLGMVATIAAIWLHERYADPQGAWWLVLPKWAPRIAAAIALMSLLTAWFFGIFVAGGSDAYGYVSQASLWASGQLITPDPLAALKPSLGAAVAPIGYRLTTAPGAIVPTYPPGLPMTMAIALKMAGAKAVYSVVPLLGALAVWLTYRVGARVDREATGLVAALLVAFSPIFMFHTFEPMSDVPVTAWWLLAWVLATSASRTSSFYAGLAVSAAILTRPNLVPLGIVLAAVVAAQPPRVPRLALFAAGSIPGCLAVAAINWRLYGSPLTSGYGALTALYEWRHWRVNLQQFGKWLIDLQTPFILLALLAPLVARVRHDLAMLLFIAVLFGCYLWYSPFPTWPFLRFLLPAIPLLLILSSAVAVRAVALLPSPLRTATIFTLCTLLALQYSITSNRLTIVRMQRTEQRYAVIGAFVGRTLPPNAIVLSMIESGSIRFYGDRLTVRWDMLPEGTLDGAVATLRQHGYLPYLLLEEWEVPMFRGLFSGSTTYGRLDWPPLFEYRGATRVRIFDFADRERFYAGENVAPTPIPTRE